MRALRRPLRVRGEDGSGMVDVMVGLLIFAILAAATTSVLARMDRVSLAAQGGEQASTLAKRLLGEARAAGCGAASGYGTPAAAGTLYSDCTWGSNSISSLSDVLATPYGASAPLLCLPGSTTKPTGACYQAGSFAETASLHFSWAWSSGAPGCQGALGLQGQPALPPDELERSVIVRWANHHAGGYHQRSLNDVSAVPPVLSSAWSAGGLGAIAVQVQGAKAPVPVGLVVPGWSHPIVTLSSVPSDGASCAWFPFVPAGPSYTVWAGTSGNALPTPAVTSERWSSLAVPA